MGVRPEPRSPAPPSPLSPSTRSFRRPSVPCRDRVSAPPARTGIVFFAPRQRDTIRDRMRDKPMACDTMRDTMRDGLEAEKQPTWTNAPLVRSARAAGGKRLDSRDPRILARQGGDQ